MQGQSEENQDQGSSAEMKLNSPNNMYKTYVQTYASRHQIFPLKYVLY
jgi:hypothetical protein